MTQDNFSISQQTNFINTKICLVYKIQNTAIRKSNDSNIKPIINHEVLS